MNKDRRKRLGDIIAKLEELQSERGSAIEENADGLDETDSDLGSLLDTLNDIMER